MTVPEWVLRHPLYPEWQRICASGAGVHPPWRESPERFVRDVLAELGPPPDVSEVEWETVWKPPEVASPGKPGES